MKNDKGKGAGVEAPAGPQKPGAQQIEQIPVADLIPYARNARTHSEEQVGQIAGSIQEFGFNVPVLIDGQNSIIAGHGRVLAAQRLKLSTVPCIRLTHLTDAQRRAYILADNRIALNSGWDEAMLQVELAELHAEELDLGLLGFEAGELEKLMGFELGDGDKEIIEDDVPEPPADPITKPGNLWILGEHRLLCGDSTKAEDVERLLGDRKPFLMVTDPPYGVEYDPDWRNSALKDGSNRRTGVVQNDEIVDWTKTYQLFPGHVAYVWHADRFAADLVVNLRAAAFEIRTQIIWCKPRFAISRGHYHWQHEPCWYAVRKGGSAKWCGDRSQSTRWDIAMKDDTGETNHGTQKPVECMARPIRNHGDASDDVYDPFLGSGTTLIAAEQLGRKCYGMEISPAYCDVIVKRWETLTGKAAVLDGQQASQEASR
jgi:DNA modification methylase